MAATENANPRSNAALQLEPYPNPPAETRLRAIIMADDIGEVQVILPERAMLDVNAIRAATGRQLRARAYEPDAPTSAVPGTYGIPVILEENLTRRGKLALATEEASKYLCASGGTLLSGYYETRTATISHPVSAEPTPGDRSGDMAQIGETLSRFTAQRMQERLDQTLHIPPLPEAARRIVALQADPNYDLADLVQIIETDPSIASRIMGWANSAFYNPDPKAKSLEDAVMRVLGFDTVMSMALGMALGQTLRMPAEEVRGLPSFWLDAIFTAATMEALARRMPQEGRPEAGLCYLAGLLSNFGTLVVGHVFPHQHAQLCLLQEANRHLPHSHVDQHVLQLPREVIASALLEAWSLPEPVTDAVRFQNLADYQGGNRTYVLLLRLSRQLLGNQGITDVPVRATDELDLATLGFDHDAVHEVMQLVNASKDELDGFANMLGRDGRATA